MKSLSIILVSCLLFSSCSIDWNGEKDKKINSLNSQIEELTRKIDEQKDEIKRVKDGNSFEKNKECQSYLAQLETKYTVEINGAVFEPHGIIFFSPVKNSCIYSYLKSIEPDPAFKIINVMTNEEQLIPYSFEKESFKNAGVEYTKIINNLKNDTGTDIKPY